MAEAPTTTTSEFAIKLQSLPFNPRTDEGRGFLPPVCRGIGHILHAVAYAASTSKYSSKTVTDEIVAALGHWQNATNNQDTFADSTKERFGVLVASLQIATNEIDTWDAKTAVDNLRNLANRCLQLVADLDRDFLGIRDSDPGYNL